MGSTSRLVAIAVAVLLIGLIAACVARSARNGARHLREQQRAHIARLGLVDVVSTQGRELQLAEPFHGVNAAVLNAVAA